MFELFSKFTAHYQKILNRALTNAQAAGRDKIDLTDLLTALTNEQGSLASDILHKQDSSTGRRHSSLLTVDETAPRKIVDEETLEDKNNNSVELLDILTNDLSPAAQKVVERSVLLAWRYQHRYIGSEHLLLALTSANEEKLKDLWQAKGLNPKKLQASLQQVMKGTSKFPDLMEAILTDHKEDEADKNSATPALDWFCVDLTNQETQGKIDPVVGRDKEIQRLINILARRTKNNPLLLGDPGVGKTAIVEGLAKRINQGQVPDFLQGKRILALDLGLVVAGTMYRGEFEGRLKQILEELKNHPEIILFIDEIHTIVGIGGAPGTLDLANLIKPALAKGLIRCIGATTLEEYKKSIESDAALERRFQVIMVRESSTEETLAVLKGLRPNYEKFHSVTISDEALEEAIRLSEKYLPEKFLPDKAIDLLDETASRLKTARPARPETIKLKQLEQRLKQLAQAKDLAISQENFELANAHKAEENKVSQEISELTKQLTAVAAPKLTILGPDIAETISLMTGLPLNQLKTDDKLQLENLESLLRSRLIGQNQAVAKVSRAIRRHRLGLGDPNRPIGSFLFLGPSGVGKTELAKLLSELIFHDPHSLIRLDMSEFGESFNVSKLIGAPAGYVGYKDTNKLTDQVKRRPYSVVLFDEIEKAHPDVFNLLLQVLDEGYLTDGAGKHINFKNSLIILTSNIGLKELTNQAQLGFVQNEAASARQNFNQNFNQAKEQLLTSVKQFFRPELLNRLDDIIIFNPLTEQDLSDIVKLQLKDFNQRLADQKINTQILLTDTTAKQIARLTFTPEQGARGIKHLLQNELEDKLTDRLLKTGPKPKTLKLSVKQGKIELR